MRSILEHIHGFCRQSNSGGCSGRLLANRKSTTQPWTKKWTPCSKAWGLLSQKDGGHSPSGWGRSPNEWGSRPSYSCKIITWCGVVGFQYWTQVVRLGSKQVYWAPLRLCTYLVNHAGLQLLLWETSLASFLALPKENRLEQRHSGVTGVFLLPPRWCLIQTTWVCSYVLT